MAPPRRPSQQLPQLGPTRTGDPLRGPRPGSANAWRDPSPQIREAGSIVAVNPSARTYTVITSSGRRTTAFRLQSSASDEDILPVGARVRIDWSLGNAIIDGVLPIENAAPEETDAPPDDPTGVDTPDSALETDMGAFARNPDAPASLLPGDFMKRSPDGAAVAALHGKVAMLHGGHMAQMQCFGNQDQVELIAGKLRVVTWMGESNVVNNGGKTSLIWKGGSSQLSETGAGEEHYTIHLDAGAEGNLVKFRVTTTSQQPVFEAHISREGHVDIFGSAGLSATFNDRQGLGHQLRFEGPIDTIHEGSQTHRIASDRYTQIEGGETLEVERDVVVRSGNDHVVQAVRHAVTTVGGTKTTQVEGESRTNVKEKATFTVGGDVESSAGGDTEFHGTGPIVIRSDGAVTLRASDDISIDAGTHFVKVSAQQLQVGGINNAVVLYNELTALLQQVLLHLGTHVHTPGLPVTSPPVTSPAIAQLSANLATLASRRLRLDS